MFANTPTVEARAMLGDALYLSLSEAFEKELMMSGINGDITLPELIKHRECQPSDVNQAFKNRELGSILRNNPGHKLITLLLRDDYVPNHLFPIEKTYANREWAEHIPFFGLALDEKSGLSIDELKRSSAVIAGLRLGHLVPLQDKFFKEFAEFRQTFPQMDKIRENAAQMYLSIFADVPQPNVHSQCLPLAQMMGLNAAGDLDFSLWRRGGQSLSDLALKTFLEVKNPNGKDIGALLSNRYSVMDTNLATLTVLPAQIFYLRGIPLDEIMQGLLERAESIARYTLGEFPEYDDYIEYAVKRPFMAFPEVWEELGICSGDFLGRTFDEPELSDIFRDTPFRNGLGKKFHYSNFYVSLPTILSGLNREGADFHNPKYLSHHGFMSACDPDFSSIEPLALKALFEKATQAGRGSPMLLKPLNSGRHKGDPLEKTFSAVAKMIGAQALAEHFHSLFNMRGDQAKMLDGSYLAEKKNIAKTLSLHDPDVFDHLFALILSEKKPKKSLVDIMLPYGRPPNELIRKLSSKHQDTLFAADLGL